MLRNSTHVLCTIVTEEMRTETNTLYFDLAFETHPVIS